MRYFSTTTGVKNNILEFSNLLGETADIIYNQIIKVLNNFNLKEKIISYSAATLIPILAVSKEKEKIIFLQN